MQPEFCIFDGDEPLRIPYATEEEVLDFANRVREAGGANALEALLPSEPGNPESCLIANALNFGCSVDAVGASEEHDGESEWVMFLPANMPDEAREKIAATTGCTLDGNGNLELPRLIGNAAHAFDWHYRHSGWVNWYAT